MGGHNIYIPKKSSSCNFAKMILDLAAWYMMDDNDPTTFVEEGGNDGTCANIIKRQSGPTSCSYSHQFNGSSSGAKYPLQTILGSNVENLTATFSIWVKVSSGASAGDIILCGKNPGSVPYGYWPGMAVKSVAKSTWEIIIGSSSAFGSVSGITKSGLNYDTWYRCLVYWRRDADDGKVYFRGYVNGSSIGNEQYYGILSSGWRETGCVGYYENSGGSGSKYLTGYLDDFKIWPQQLTDAEIICDFNNGKCYT